MTPRRLFALVGFTWGLVLGAVAAWWMLAAAAGFAWLFLFGDSPWPEAAAWVLPALALAAGLAVVIGCTALGYFYGDHLVRSPQVPAAAARHRAYGLIALAVLVASGLVWITFHRVHDQADRRVTVDQAQAWFEDLRAATHVVSEVTFDPESGEVFRFTVTATGMRAGAYRLSWAVEDKAYRKTLAENTRRVTLAAGPARLPITVPADQIKASYRAQVLHEAAAPVLVEEPFRLTLKLAPILSEDERDRLPVWERTNLERGYSDLVSEGGTEFPVRFLYPGTATGRAPAATDGAGVGD